MASGFLLGTMEASRRRWLPLLYIVASLEACTARPLARRTTLHGCIAAGLGAMGGLQPAGLPGANAMEVALPDVSMVRGEGFTVAIPVAYYRPTSRPKTGAYDDMLLVAADYPNGRVASVSRTFAADLLRDAGEPEALTGPLSELTDLGRPIKVASLLARRRDGDPSGTLAQQRSQVVSATREGNELHFVVRELTYTPTSMTKAQPSARIVQARSIFLPQTSAQPPCILTAWAGSPAPSVECIPIACESSNIQFDCPAPRCEAGGEPPRDEVDSSIVASLRSVQ